MITTTRTIDSDWTVTQVWSEDGDPALRLPALPAQVPGHVHLDLQRAGVIPDPFYRLHERDVAWVDNADWVYETTFNYDPGSEADIFLRFLGLDTVADISLNGDRLGRTDNMFVPHEFDVTSLLRRGRNSLRVTFHAACRVGRERQQEWLHHHSGMPRSYNVWDARSFVRKAQYMFGWDWGPVLVSCGIWRPVELVTVPIARLIDWRYAVTFQGDEAALEIEIAICRASRAAGVDLTLLVDVDGAGRVEVRVPDGGGLTRATATITVPNARRWNPESPELYDLRIDLSAGDRILETRRGRIGLRTLELIREPDADGSGESFRFRVNGDDLFCKGANWIPADSFPSRYYDDASVLRPLLESARECGFNMLRVWGGGLYESETFYSLCDELGILVWQDFPYACAYYPDDEQSLARAAEEARAAVRRLRVHPSLALWCGNNENHQMFYDNWQDLSPPRFLGEQIYHHALPEVVSAEDASTPYWPGSAYGGVNPDSPDAGDRHNWDVWHAHSASDGDWTYYTTDRARFCSEFGFASSCGSSAWSTCLAPEDRQPHSAAVQWHDKTRKPYEVYLGYIERHFPHIRSLDDLVYFSMLNQAEAMKFGVEHYRRLKGRCWGTLIWQINDCWPVQSWSMIDYLGERKAVYYAAKRFYAPVLLSLTRGDDGVDVVVVNDGLDGVSGTLRARIVTFDGAVVREVIDEIAVGGNSVERVARIPCQDLAIDVRDVFVHASVALDGGRAQPENLLFLAEPKDLRLPDPRVEFTVSEADGRPAVNLGARRFAAYVRLAAPGLGPLAWSDNYVHLLPGRSHTVSVPPDVSVEALREHLRVRALTV